MPDTPALRVADAFRAVGACVEKRPPQTRVLLALIDDLCDVTYHIGGDPRDWSNCDAMVDLRELLRAIRRELQGHE